MDAWADGLNFYLHTHPDVKPRVITRFEPWMALSFSEGSIGGDIESVALDELRAFYGDSAGRPAPAVEPGDRATGRADGLQRLRDRAGEHGEPPGAPPDQSAHLVLLPLRAPDDERRGAQRLRRGDLGAVLHLSGLQRRGSAGCTPRPARTRSTSTPRRRAEGRRRCSIATGTSERPVVAERIARPLSDGEAAWRRGRSPSTAPTTARSCARRRASGSASG